MSQNRARESSKLPAPKQPGTSAAAKPAKDWSVKVAVRLPHKIGQPLGSSASDGGSE